MSVSTKLQKIATQAREHPERSFTTLAHYIDLDFLKEAYRRTNRGRAPGIDGVTEKNYEKNLESNLQDLLDRFKSGRYRAPDVRRSYIPKGDGKTRELGIPTFEDRVLQKAVAMIVEAVVEQDFLSCSYGYRPGRSPRGAIQSIWDETMRMGGGWIVEADISDCFGSFDHEWMRKILSLRIGDGVLLRTISKWMKAGVVEQGIRTISEEGTPQGGVISPLLANIFLHHVLDSWFYRYARPQLRGRVELVRYADDFVLLCEFKEDAERLYKGIHPRFEKYGLALHPKKTKLVPFKRPPRGGPNESESWEFLGFTHFWSKSRKGNWVVFRKTAPSRLRRALSAVAEWCRKNRHRPVKWQFTVLSKKIKGHCGYYGITGNSVALNQFRSAVRNIWRKWLRRRSGGAARKNWAWWDAFFKRYRLPPAYAVHSKLRPR